MNENRVNRANIFTYIWNEINHNIWNSSHSLRISFEFSLMKRIKTRCLLMLPWGRQGSRTLPFWLLICVVRHNDSILYIYKHCTHIGQCQWAGLHSMDTWPIGLNGCTFGWLRCELPLVHVLPILYAYRFYVWCLVNIQIHRNCVECGSPMSYTLHLQHLLRRTGL